MHDEDCLHTLRFSAGAPSIQGEKLGKPASLCNGADDLSVRAIGRIQIEETHLYVASSPSAGNQDVECLTALTTKHVRHALHPARSFRHPTGEHADVGNPDVTGRREIRTRSAIANPERGVGFAGGRE